MININEFDIGYKSAILFGLASLFFSFLIGVISGNEVSVIIVRSLLFMIGFSFLGFISVYIIKKYVPEFYDVLLLNQSNSDVENRDIALEESSEDDKKADSLSDSITMEENDVKPQNIEIPDIDDELTSFKGSAVKGADLDKSNSGKIPVDIMTQFNEKIKYEPKIMAQAVRTMMKRDTE